MMTRLISITLAICVAAVVVTFVRTELEKVNQTFDNIYGQNTYMEYQP